MRQSEKSGILTSSIITSAIILMLPTVTQAVSTAPVTTQWGTVSEPVYPSVCTTLRATLTQVSSSLDAADGNASNSKPDAIRIQAALNGCAAGQAVRLVKGAAGESAFLSGALTLKSGVTLWIDSGVTLFGSRNPADYDNGVGTCGTATVANTKSCNPLITASGTANSGIVGDGIIDGRGGSMITSGPNAKLRSWWDVAWQNKSAGLYQQNPKLLQVTGGSNFTLHNVTLQNSPNFHIVTSGVVGLTAWGIKILSPSAVYTKPAYACPAGTTPDVKTPATCFTPGTAKNTDGFDPGQSSNVLLAYSYISTGDDDVAIKAHNGPLSQNHTYAHNHFYYGHGMSVGSETDAGLSNVMVTDLTIDGQDASNSTGLHIKSDAAAGGHVDNVTYSHVCMRNMQTPIAFDPFYNTTNSGHYPNFTNIKLVNVHALGSAKYAGGKAIFKGYELNGQNNPLTISLDNVVFDGAQPIVDANAAHFTFGPGTVSFASSIVPSSATDVTVTGASGSSTAIDCSKAFVKLNTVMPTSPF